MQQASNDIYGLFSFDSQLLVIERHQRVLTIQRVHLIVRHLLLLILVAIPRVAANADKLLLDSFTDREHLLGVILVVEVVGQVEQAALERQPRLQLLLTHAVLDPGDLVGDTVDVEHQLLVRIRKVIGGADQAQVDRFVYVDGLLVGVIAVEQGVGVEDAALKGLLRRQALLLHRVPYPVDCVGDSVDGEDERGGVLFDADEAVVDRFGYRDGVGVLQVVVDVLLDVDYAAFDGLAQRHTLVLDRVEHLKSEHLVWWSLNFSG